MSTRTFDEQLKELTGVTLSEQLVQLREAIDKADDMLARWDREDREREARWAARDAELRAS